MKTKTKLTKREQNVLRVLQRGLDPDIKNLNPKKMGAVTIPFGDLINLLKQAHELGEWTHDGDAPAHGW